MKKKTKVALFLILATALPLFVFWGCENKNGNNTATNGSVTTQEEEIILSYVDTNLSMIVGDEKKFFSNGNGQFAYGFGPVFKCLKVDAENTIDNKILRYGNMRAFVRHENTPCPLQRTKPGKGKQAV